MQRFTSLVLSLGLALQRWFLQTRSSILAKVSGQGLVEYGLILVLIMVVCVGILTAVGGTISEVWYTKLINGIPW
jgi:pilus assembly protein Flp/PilA